MNLCPSRLLMVLAFGLAATAASAQEKIVFSKPADDAATKINPPQSDAKRLWGVGAYNAPHPVFNNSLPNPPPLPSPQPMNNSASVQDALNKRKNWTLLTPEQILGVQTPEQIMGVADPKGETKLSLEEQFLLRQSRAESLAAANGRANSILLHNERNLFEKNKDDQSPFARTPSMETDENAPSGSTRSLNSLWNVDGKNSSLGSDRKRDSLWNSVFAQPAPPKPTPAQLEDMDRFRALMEPSSPPDKAPSTVRYPAAPPARAVDPYLQPQPQYNPAGHSVVTLEDNIARPAGIQPLPGVTGPVKTSPQTKPTWQAQLPPWMQSGPPSHNVNRNY